MIMKLLGRWLGRLLMFVAVAAFLSWGLIGLSSAPSVDSIAEIGSSQVPLREFQENLDNYVQRSLGIAKYVGMDAKQRRQVAQSVFSSMLSGYLLSEYAKQYNLILPDYVVAKAVKANAAFQDKNGNFSSLVFEEILNANGMDKTSFFEQQKQNMLNAMIVQGVQVPWSAQAKPIKRLVLPKYSYANDLITAEYINVSDNVSTENMARPSMEDLIAFRRDNSELFLQKERRSFGYVSFKRHEQLDAIASNISIDKALIEQTYQKDLDQYKQPERRDIAQVTFLAKEDADKFFQAVQQTPKLFKNIAKQMGLTVNKMDKVEAAFLQSEEKMSHFIFQDAVGQVSEPIQSTVGWHVIRILAIYKTYTMPLDKVFDDISYTLSLKKARTIFQQHLAQVQTILAEEGDMAAFDAVTKLFKVSAKNILDIDEMGYEEDGTRLEMDESMGSVVAEAFKQPVMRMSLVQPVEGEYIAIIVQDIKPEITQPFDSTNVIPLYLKQQKKQKINEMAQDILVRLRAGISTMAHIAAELGQPIQTTKPFSRMSRQTEPIGLSTAIKDRLFEEKYVSGQNEHGFVIAYAAEKENNSDVSDTVLKRYYKELLSEISGSFIDHYMGMIQTDVHVRINDAMYQDAMDKASFITSGLTQ